MKNSAFRLSVFTVFVLLSNAAISASHNKLVYIDEYDSNGDFAVSQREFDVVRVARFSYTDTDNNGTVNEAEYVAEYMARLNTQMGEERIGSIKQALIRFDSLDSDDNRQVTWEEISASGDSTFNHFDENKDGVINDKDSIASEFSSNKNKELSDEEQQKQRDRELAAARRALQMTSTHNRHGMMQKYDTDKDGVITHDDFVAYRKNNFQESDTNHDGWLSKEEYINEYTARVDEVVAETRSKQYQQTFVRFKALDKDENGEMSFAEYQQSGHNSFTRWDTDKDGYVSMDDPEPESAELAQQ